jgi:aminoglycoside 6'-N-acetyltransferase
MNVVHGTHTVVRHSTDKDVDMLVAWHADPDVKRYWDDQSFRHDEMIERLARADVESFIVEADGEPIGYVEAWTDDDVSGGIDMFLVPSARGRGLGPDAARALAQHLRAERGWTHVTADPYLWNEGAIRGWRRAGFEPVEEREPDEEQSSRRLLMEFRPGRSA